MGWLEHCKAVLTVLYVEMSTQLIWGTKPFPKFWKSGEEEPGKKPHLKMEPTG
jgi:hypothetical protein